MTYERLLELDERRNVYRDALHGRQPSSFEILAGAMSEAILSIARFVSQEDRLAATQVLARYEQMGERATRKVGFSFLDFYNATMRLQKGGIPDETIRQVVMNGVRNIATCLGEEEGR